MQAYKSIFDMGKLKLAVLEDSKLVLKEQIGLLKETGLVEIVAYASTSEDFLEKCAVQQPDALILDIDLSGDSMSGIDVAHSLKLPTMFVTGKMRDNIENIENIRLLTGIHTEYIVKPLTKGKIETLLPKFIEIVTIQINKKVVTLNFKSSKGVEVPIDSIVYLCSDKNHGAISNNKVIYFKNRHPEVLVDFSFSKMEQYGLDTNIFITPHQSYRVNVNEMTYPSPKKKGEKRAETLTVSAQNEQGKTQEYELPVSGNYRKNVIKAL